MRIKDKDSVEKIQTVEECIARAEEEGLEAFFAESNELFIDLDFKNGKMAELNEGVYQMLFSNGYPVVSRLDTVSKSGIGVHVYLRLDHAFDSTERALLQCALGSDAKKEVFAVIGKQFSALYETPYEACKVKAWREAL